MRYDHNHPKKLIIDDPSHRVKTRSSLREAMNHITFISQLEPKNVIEAEKDPNCILAMQEE